PRLGDIRRHGEPVPAARGLRSTPVRDPWSSWCTASQAPAGTGLLLGTCFRATTGCWRRTGPAGEPTLALRWESSRTPKRSATCLNWSALRVRRLKQVAERFGVRD